MIVRLASLAFGAALALAAFAPAAPAQKKHVGKPIVPIAIVINGTTLSVDPRPRMVKSHLLVPVRRIIEALGLAFDKEGKRIVTHAGYKTIALVVGSRRAQVDGEEVLLDAAPVEIDGTLYAPLRFFTAALGAQAVFSRQTNSVVITSTLVGRSGNGIVADGARREEIGTVTAVDLDSTPPTITLTYNASVRTIALAGDASVVVQDVNTNTSTSGDPASIHVGDFAHVLLDARGRAKRIVDAFGSRAGEVAAVAGNQLVLDDGHVIEPDRDTTITLNGVPAQTGDLRVGDQVMVRYNIDSSEVLQIVATRAASGTPAPAGSVQIAGIDFSPDHPARGGQSIVVTLRGTPGGTASFDVGPYVRGLPMQETSPGIYTGTYTVQSNVNFANAPIFGHLNVGGLEAPQAESRAELSVSNAPPGIVDHAPENGAVVNSARPSIYATFSAGTVDVDRSSVTLEVNGRDVTSESVRTTRFIEYTPDISYPDGKVRVTVHVSDAAGNTTSKTWTFFIKR